MFNLALHTNQFLETFKHPRFNCTHRVWETSGFSTQADIFIHKRLCYRERHTLGTILQCFVCKSGIVSFCIHHFHTDNPIKPLSFTVYLLFAGLAWCGHSFLNDSLVFLSIHTQTHVVELMVSKW